MKNNNYYDKNLYLSKKLDMKAEGWNVKRRTFIKDSVSSWGISAIIWSKLGNKKLCHAADQILLLQRIEKNDFEKLDLELGSMDIPYPSWFEGVWDTVSTTQSVEAPAGKDFFGGSVALTRAKREIGAETQYPFRFKKLKDGSIVEDRAFNRESLMLVNNGMELPNQSDPNYLEMALFAKVEDAEGELQDEILTMQFKTIGRRFEEGMDENGNPVFTTCEIVRETTKSALNPSKQSFDAKDVENIISYTRISENKIVAKQRTAFFLAPLNLKNKKAIKQIGSVAVDVREYQNNMIKFEDIEEET
eukprot:CAMPEP_0117756910 /NCGR_PEP_ID=MMETSP0947-20121206/14387_1 /TAXON_ID=44440 /ORGANISM="Chattonella subsalsa, Strain CCMP2191" /LENGTH=303 /DNA_ID=CAMNT_0005576643 /DNA_START=175 /DNA_END=1086 /DNA_ORIENTATION=+